MIIKVNVTLFKQFLGLYCPSKLIVWLTHDVFLISLIYRIFSSLNQFHLPLFMNNNVNVTLLRQFLSRLVLFFQAYYQFNSRCLHYIIFI